MLVIYRGPKIIKLLGFIFPIIIVLVLVSPISKFIVDSIQGREPSFNYHVQTLMASLNFLIQHPWGVGLGKVGVAALRLGGGRGIFRGFLLQSCWRTGMGLPGLFLDFSNLDPDKFISGRKTNF